MSDHLINAWSCNDCGENFYTDLEMEPEFCPYCQSTDLEDSKVLEAKPFIK